jgi:hypothetical protein
LGQFEPIGEVLFGGAHASFYDNLCRSTVRALLVHSQASVWDHAFSRLAFACLSIKRRTIVKKLFVVLVMVGVSMCGSGGNAQTAPAQENNPHVISSQDLDLLRKDIRSKKKQLVAANLKLTDSEATKFWPIYDQYTAELIAINDKKFALVQNYADNWGKLTNEQSLSFIRQWLDMDILVAQLRQKYVPIVSQVLDGRKSATFFQLDRRMSMMIDLQVSSQMPLVQAQE